MSDEGRGVHDLGELGLQTSLGRASTRGRSDHAHDLSPGEREPGPVGREAHGRDRRLALGRRKRRCGQSCREEEVTSTHFRRGPSQPVTSSRTKRPPSTSLIGRPSAVLKLWSGSTPRSV